MRPSYSPLYPLPPATCWLFTHCVHHTVLCLSYLQPHPCSLYIASTILSSVAPTSSHILTPDTLHPSYSPLSPLPLAASWFFTHCVHHTVLCLSYLQPHPCSLYIASTILSSVSPTSSHILTPDTLRPSYIPLSPLPLATSWLFTHCVHHTVLCLSYLQPNPCSLYIASTILSSVAPTSSHILAPDTLHPSYSHLSFLLPATPFILIHCVHHTVLSCSYRQPHPGSLYISSIILSSAAPTSSHILAPDTLHPSYSPLSFLPPAAS